MSRVKFRTPSGKAQLRHYQTGAIRAIKNTEEMPALPRLVYLTVLAFPSDEYRNLVLEMLPRRSPKGSLLPELREILQMLANGEIADPMSFFLGPDSGYREMILNSIRSAEFKKYNFLFDTTDMQALFTLHDAFDQIEDVPHTEYWLRTTTEEQKTLLTLCQERALKDLQNEKNLYAYLMFAQQVMLTEENGFWDSASEMHDWRSGTPARLLTYVDNEEILQAVLQVPHRCPNHSPFEHLAHIIRDSQDSTIEDIATLMQATHHIPAAELDVVCPIALSSADRVDVQSLVSALA